MNGLLTTAALYAAGKTPAPDAPGTQAQGVDLAWNSGWVIANLWAAVTVLGAWIVCSYLARHRKVTLGTALIAVATVGVIMLIPAIIVYMSNPQRGVSILEAVFNV